ncbi:MAG: type V CRISPR-associated protein Cas12a/Cpf1, partial [Bacteroidales bacterium]|nr:type V CRISPR-associated protein Cas12a/Cpf1 [Bacteroidales bacterium]
MVYKQIALPTGFGGFVRKCFKSANALGWSCPSKFLDEDGKIIIADEKAKPVLPELIDCYKDFLNIYEKDGFKYKDFNFKFKESNEYEKLSHFFNDIEPQGYKLSFQNVSISYINELVENGKMFLFQIYNKDYAQGAHGTKNLHTLYWENLFSEENLKDYSIVLKGGAELFYRKGSIENPVVHKVGQKMLNKRDKSGMPIPDAVYQELYRFYNGKLSEAELSEDAKRSMNDVIVKDVTHEIVKDRRYTKPHFQFHVPLKINFKAQGSGRINAQVNEYLKNNPDVNIIGLDRGERHLIYLTLINQKGEILKQKTFNIVNQMNYQEKLTQREKERDAARKSWQSVGQIKELKEGFLSAVIHEITDMMVEYNAIVVMEDLNFGFKRGRFKVERQVYQKFEKMLIDKLNYLPSKKLKVDEDGGILRGYQLTEQFESFQKMGKQNGFLFYIPAAYTSKIDPVSGFVNLFNFNDLTNAAARKEFFGKFEAIKFVSEDEGFEFTFNYDKFKTHQTDYRKQWTVSSRGKRIVMQEVNQRKEMHDYYPTEELIQAFQKMDVKLTPGMELKDIIASFEANNANASFFSNLMFAFKSTLQMRNSKADTEEDFIVSPVSVGGNYYNSDAEANKGHDAEGNWISKLPVDADANGAYHIALKGLYFLLHPEEKKLEHAKWLEFMQIKPYKH